MKYLEVCLQTSIFAPLFNRKCNKFGLWCNGSTTGFGSVCPSSNLGSPTKEKPRKRNLLGLFFFLLFFIAACKTHNFNFIILISVIVYLL